MITPKSARLALSLFCLGALPLAPLSARVGETQDVIERRLLQPNLGRLHFQAKEKDNKEAERVRAKELKEQPFNEARKFFPAEAREATYWKSAVARQLSNDNGWKIPDLRALRRDRIGFVFQAPYLIPFLDVIDNVALLPMLAGRPNGESRKRALELLEALDVGHRAKAQPSQRSGGEQHGRTSLKGVQGRARRTTFSGVVLGVAPLKWLALSYRVSLLTLVRRTTRRRRRAAGLAAPLRWLAWRTARS